MNCPVCKKELIQFDDLVWRCRSDSAHHHYSCLVYDGKIDFELIKFPTSNETAFGLEVNHQKKFTQITKIKGIHKMNGEIISEYTIPFYVENIVMYFDFDDIPALIKRLELLETFS